MVSQVCRSHFVRHFVIIAAGALGDASVIFHEFLDPGRVQPVNQRSFAGDGELVLAQDSPSIAGVEFFHRGIRSDGNLADFLSPRPSRGGRPDQDAFKPVLSENGFGIDISGKAGQYALVAEILEGKNGGARSDEDDGGNEQGEGGFGRFIHDRAAVVTVSNIRGSW